MSQSVSPLVEAAELPVGYRGPRGSIVVELKRSAGLTAKELAAKLGLSLNATRHHIRELEADGLLVYEREQRGVGAPVFVYRLSRQGEALFPRRYEQTLTELLDHVVEREGRAGAVRLLERHFDQLQRKLVLELDGVSAPRRLAVVAQVLSQEGFMAESEGSGESGTLREHNCALRSVAERFPELCAAERRVLAEVLAAEVERRTHLLGGCAACEYHVQFTPMPEQTGPGENAD
ncbi:MAG TPA: winged helix-turn-helix transcriptional regulator [Gemmatimonadales bacterium]|nr:winged helix-turn-helix transcriptional regulator [Gemmatimonadales bacterium]